MVMFDLDPGAPADLVSCAQVAVWLKEVLDSMKLDCFPKTSGSKGIQVCLPLNTMTSYQITRPFAKAVAELLEKRHPELVVSTMSKSLRTGKVFIDWSQNAEHKSTVNVYSLRAREKPYVSTPVKWSELETALKKADPERLLFEPNSVLARTEKFGDLLKPVLTLKQRIPKEYSRLLTVDRKKDRGLGAYRAKRDFSRTAEPAPSELIRSGKGGEFLYVIQKHKATRLHYDFRLEMQGVLRSWAVPKGIPLTRGDRRMAVHVEDHPMDYARFEGTIPSGNYGAGTVMVWDIGSYTVKDKDPVHDYYAGKLHLILKGKKLNGEWVLVKIGKKNQEEDKSWLLMKAGEDLRPVKDDQSVLTGRSMKKIASDNDAQWISGKKASHAPSGLPPGLLRILRKLPAGEPAFLEPMLSKPVAELPKGKDWIYEVKFDGYRAVAVKDGNETKLISRNSKNLGKKYPEILDALRQLPVDKAVLDGEIVAVNEQGIPSFQMLQNLSSSGERPIHFYAFDLLHYEGRDTTRLPLIERKRLLENLLSATDGVILYSASLEGDTAVLVEEVEKRGLEGIIAKRKGSVYESAKRTGAWVKFKTEREQEFFIGAYRPSGKKDDFEMLLLGDFQQERFMYAGKLRAGYTVHIKKNIASKMRTLARKECPFDDLPQKSSGRWGEGLTREEMKDYVWLKPELRCRVRFVEWTQEGHLRHPRFVSFTG
jgi:bifunctional non-homologous end joining protein LigD